MHTYIHTLSTRIEWYLNPPPPTHTPIHPPHCHTDAEALHDATIISLVVLLVLLVLPTTRSVWSFHTATTTLQRNYCHRCCTVVVAIRTPIVRGGEPTTPTFLMAEDEPVWRALSKELEAVVRTYGPLPLSDVAGIFQAVHSKPFKLGGHKLRDCLRQEGQLLGAVRINWETGMLETKKKKRAAAPKVATATSTIKEAIAASKLQAKPGTAWQDAPPSTMPLPDEPLVSYHLIDSVQSCTVALIAMSPEYDGGAVSLSLRRICRGLAIAVVLDGTGLGTEEGNLSLVKVGQ